MRSRYVRFYVFVFVFVLGHCLLMGSVVINLTGSVWFFLLIGKAGMAPPPIHM